MVTLLKENDRAVTAACLDCEYYRRKLQGLQSAVEIALLTMEDMPAAAPLQTALSAALTVSQMQPISVERPCAFVSAFNLPPIELSPNKSPQTEAQAARRNRAKQRYKRDCAITFGVARSGRLGLPLPCCSIVFDWYLGDNPLLRDACYFPNDKDNALASLKSAIDALKDAGIIVDDNSNRVVNLTCNLITDPKIVQRRAEIVVKIYAEE
jgi:hypothetical protein